MLLKSHLIIINFLCCCSPISSFLIFLGFLQYVDGIIFAMLRFRTDRTVKHIEVLLDETTQKYRVKDESDAVSYANFLQFDSIQQLLDQCKQHASKMGAVLAYDKFKPNKTISRICKCSKKRGPRNEFDVTPAILGSLRSYYGDAKDNVG